MKKDQAPSQGMQYRNKNAQSHHNKPKLLISLNSQNRGAPMQRLSQAVLCWPYQFQGAVLSKNCLRDQGLRDARCKLQLDSLVSKRINSVSSLPHLKFHLKHYKQGTNILQPIHTSKDNVEFDWYMYRKWADGKENSVMCQI